jgi:hypothetical protein
VPKCCERYERRSLVYTLQNLIASPPSEPREKRSVSLDHASICCVLEDDSVELCRGGCVAIRSKGQLALSSG